MAKETQQEKLEAALREAFATYERSLFPLHRKAVQQSVHNAKNDLMARISELADSKGKLPKNSLNAVQSEIDALERMIYTAYTQALRRELQAASSSATVSTAEALIAALGPSAIMALTGMATASTLRELVETGVLNSLVLSLILGVSVVQFSAEMAERILSRSVNGTNTRRRIRIFAREVSQEIKRAVQKVAQRGGQTGEILRQIEQILRETDWRVERLVDTESMTAYRTSVARLSEMADVFDNVKIIDFPDGHRATHTRHKCYQFAHKDEHGLGIGVYPASTQKIRNPHPQCRSILVPILAENR